MRPELPYLGAGAVALIGGARTEGGFPRDGMRSIIATAILVLIASATSETRAAPLVKALGLLLLLAAIYGTVRRFQTKPKGSSNGR